MAKPLNNSKKLEKSTFVAAVIVGILALIGAFVTIGFAGLFVYSIQNLSVFKLYAILIALVTIVSAGITFILGWTALNFVREVPNDIPEEDVARMIAEFKQQRETQTFEPEDKPEEA